MSDNPNTRLNSLIAEERKLIRELRNSYVRMRPGGWEPQDVQDQKEAAVNKLNQDYKEKIAKVRKLQQQELMED